MEPPRITRVDRESRYRDVAVVDGDQEFGSRLVRAKIARPILQVRELAKTSCETLLGFLVDRGQKRFGVLELLARLDSLVDQLASVRFAVSKRAECYEGFFDYRRCFGGTVTEFVAADHQRESGHLSAQFGDNAFAGRGADARQCGQRLGVLFFNQDREFTNGTDHRSKCFLHPNTVDAAEQIKELTFGEG